MRRITLLLALLALTSCGEDPLTQPNDWQDRNAIIECGEDVISTEEDEYVLANSFSRRVATAEGTSLETAYTPYPRKDGGEIRVYERVGRQGQMVLSHVDCHA